MADRVAVMYAGRIVEDGATRDIFDDPQHPYTQALLRASLLEAERGQLFSIPGSVVQARELEQGCRFLPRCPVSAALGIQEHVRECRAGAAHLRRRTNTTVDATHRESTRRQDDHGRHRGRCTGGQPSRPCVELHDVVKHFPAGQGKTVHSVDGVALAVRKGEVLGLVGESGCGKSTLARTILRAVAASSGHIVFDGRDITRAKGKELKALRRSMQFVFQDPYGAFDPKMSLGSQPGGAAAPPRHEESRGAARTDAGHARPRRARGGDLGATAE